jgi:hypothetical protein
MGRRGRRAVRLGIPALIVGALTFAALWRVGSLGTPRADPATGQKAAPLPPITELTDVTAATAIGRRASLDNVAIREVPSARTLWVGADGERVFVVLDPDVKRHHEARLVEGARVTLIGLVRPAPAADVAIRQWNLDPATAQIVQEAGTYVHATEVRPAA